LAKSDLDPRDCQTVIHESAKCAAEGLANPPVTLEELFYRTIESNRVGRPTVGSFAGPVFDSATIGPVHRPEFSHKLLTGFWYRPDWSP
jgi:hypothetical protein